ncbi:MAG: bioY [Gammaproteobacteria bacterium]|nr:bioY [Gammaproteobacteria bacterium]
MVNFLLTSQNLQSICWPNHSSLVKELLLIFAGALVLSITAQLCIPLHPVPITFQSATVILFGLIYGAKRAAGVIALYLWMGACGLPVFTEMHSGIAVFLGPTGGYLLGFLPASILTGYLAQKGWANTLLTSFLAACLGATVIFCSGLANLAIFAGWHQALLVGLKPFLLTELIKLFVVAIFIPKFWKPL